MTFGKIKAKETRELTRTLEKTSEAKLACSDTADIDNKILNNEIDKLEKELEQIYEQKAKGAQIRPCFFRFYFTNRHSYLSYFYLKRVP
jgi:dynactin complex subunit